MAKAVLKPVVWVGSTRKDLRAFPQAVQRVVGQALFVAQLGETPPDAKPLKGSGGGGVIELIENHRGDTYRAVYTVRFTTKIYVLHVFQKKSKRGIATPKKELDLIRERLRWAELLYQGKMQENRL